jgi:hypothetical protein
MIKAGIEVKVNKWGDKRYFLNYELHREDGPAIIRANGNTEYWLHGELQKNVDRDEAKKEEPSITTDALDDAKKVDIDERGNEAHYLHRKFNKEDEFFPEIWSDSLMGNPLPKEDKMTEELIKEKDMTNVGVEVVLHKNGSVMHFLDGKLHREDGKPAVIWADGPVKYYLHGKLHREGDKPAVIENDGSVWYRLHGKLHREGDKPAVIWADGAVEHYQRGRKHRDGDKPAVIYLNGDVQYWLHGKQYEPTQGVQDD